MRAGNDEQSAAALPFRTQAGIDERMRTGDCYRNAGSYKKECHDAERSQLSPDEIHEHSSQRLISRAFTSPVDHLWVRTNRPKL